MTIAENVVNLRKQIPPEVTIVAAAKAQPIEKIKQAVEAGIKIIGENYVKEAVENYEELKGKCEIHCIGPLQTNKIKKAVEIFDMIQTVDSLKIAKEIDKRAEERFPVLVQVNIGKEETKSGVMPDECAKLIKEISLMENIKVHGLMAIPPFFQEPEYTSTYFKEMKHLFDSVKSLTIPNSEMQFLSIGMSHDYPIAVEEGSNMVRIGTAIFGKRS